MNVTLRGEQYFFFKGLKCKEVSVTSWSLVQRSPTECVVSKKCDREASKKLDGLGPQGAVEPLKSSVPYHHFSL
jgi:hypothetical protein